MISEHEFANSFDAFWESSFPLLSPSFIKDFNLKHVKKIPNPAARVRLSYLRPVPLVASKPHADIVAELAFEVFVEIYKRTRNPDLWQATDADFESAAKRVVTRFARLKNKNEVEWVVTGMNTEREVRALVKVYASFFAAFCDTRIMFRPRIRGAGILRTVEADLCTVNSLVEIKTVNRNLTSNDFRQLLVYLALGLSSGQYRWTEAVFFNPRRAVSYSFNVTPLITYLSARNATNVFDEFIYFLSEREMDLRPVF